MDEALLPGAVPGFPAEMGVRELGGLRGADGRPVRHGLFYRGAALCGLTAEQRSLVDSWGLAFMLDLRAQGETEGRADYVPQGVEYRRIGGMREPDGTEVDFSPAGIARLAERIAELSGTFMEELYSSMMFGNPAVHELMSRLENGQVPLYFHCTAGKDRTGVCAAVILMLLGVSDDDIVQEFLLTNEYRSSIIHMSADELPEGLSEHDREHWAQLNGVSESDLRAALAAVDGRFCSREAYFESEFGLDACALKRLRDRYLASIDTPLVPTPEAHRLLETPYVRVYDLEYADGTHYVDASRREPTQLRAIKSQGELLTLPPDAVACCLVLDRPSEDPRIVLFYEYRYPVGHYVLSIPSGLLEPQDRSRRDPLVAAMVREINEETGIVFGARDSIRVVNPLLFDSPGFTDESCALLCAVIRTAGPVRLSQEGATGTERFGGFELLTKTEAEDVLREGKDRYGNAYPLITWAALMYFANDWWRGAREAE